MMRGNEAADTRHTPITVNTLGEIESDQTEKSLLAFLKCAVLSPSLYKLI